MTPSEKRWIRTGSNTFSGQRKRAPARSCEFAAPAIRQTPKAHIDPRCRTQQATARQEPRPPRVQPLRCDTSGILDGDPRLRGAPNPYNLCASVLKKLTRDPASTDLGLESPSYSNSCPFVVQNAPQQPLAIIRVNPCSSVAKKRPWHATCTRVFASSRESINQDMHPRTPVRGSPDRTPKTENRTCAFPFAASREPDSLQSPRFAQPRQDRSRAGKPELQQFVTIRVHSWFKTPLAIIRDNPCSSVAKKHPWHTTCPRSVA